MIRNTNTLILVLSRLVLAFAFSAWWFASYNNAWSAIGMFFGSYFLLGFSTLHLSKWLNLTSKTRHALKILSKGHRGNLRVSIKKSDTEGLGSIAGEPYHLAAIFDDVGVNISIHYDPIVRPRNIHLLWESIKTVWLDEHELVISIKAHPSIEIRMPRAFGGKYPRSLRNRLDGDQPPRNLLKVDEQR